MTKTIVVTGGAGQLGSAICSELEENNYQVVTTDIKNNYQKRGLHPIKMDITQVQSIRDCFSKIKKYYGDIYGLINNAGVAVFTPMMDRTWAEFDHVMKVNCYGTFFCTQEALKHMKKGVIVNIASMYGLIAPDKRIYGDSGRDSSEVYGMSKAAIIQLTKYLATHINPDIRVNCISPGGIFNNQDKDFIKQYEDSTPMKRLANDTEIAKVVKFLCSDDSSYINGENIVVDGGKTLW